VSGRKFLETVEDPDEVLTQLSALFVKGKVTQDMVFAFFNVIMDVLTGILRFIILYFL